MRIYNAEKTKVLENVDLELGYLQGDRLLISEEQQEQFHYEEKKYDNGGIARYKIVDKPYKPAEYEDIQVYILYTKKELNQNKINELTSWFDNYFDKQLTQSQWQKNFKVSEDPYFKDESGQPKTYADIDELKAQAEIVRETIKSLRSGV